MTAEPLWRGPLGRLLNLRPSDFGKTLSQALGTEVEVWPAGDRTCPYVETGDEGTSYCSLAEAGDRPTREQIAERLEALEAFRLREDKDGRALLTYEHADGEACVVAELTCPAVAEVAAVLWPTTEPEWSGGTMSDAIEENTGD